MLKVDSLWSLLDQTAEPFEKSFEDSNPARLGRQLDFPLESATASQFTYSTNVAAVGVAEPAAIQQIILAPDFQVLRDDPETLNNSEPPSSQGASEIVAIAEGYLAQNAGWGNGELHRLCLYRLNGRWTPVFLWTRWPPRPIRKRS